MNPTTAQRVHPLAKYAALGAIAARQTLVDRAVLLGRAVFIGLFLLIFSQLWKTVLSMGQRGEHSVADLVWYLLITETVLIATPYLHLDIEKDIRNGDVANHLPRPVSYLWSQVSQGIGQLVVRFPAVALCGALMAWGLTGELPSNPAGLLYALPLTFLACCAVLISNITIGLLAVWIVDINPLVFVWQKLSFILGGLIFPMDIYPDWLRAVSEWTPFYAYLYGVGRLAYTPDPMVALGSAGMLLFWCAVFVWIALWVYRKALRVMTISGG
ncbi:MAG: ABC transporter permease [Planctomycetes bacterium]|nr:ABC transporter permease [Planctomycetota bacterium]NUQ33961.1 ABC transporter permease [Planctomycetaceae bacterium]